MHRSHRRGTGKVIKPFMLVALLGAALCLPAQAQDAPRPERPPPVEPAPALGPDDAVRQLYTLPDPDFAAFGDPARRPSHYTPRIVKRARAMEACYLKKYGQGWLDFNFLLPGQDYDLGEVRVRTEKESRTKAVVRVDVLNSGAQMTLTHHLRKIDGRWLVDDLVFSGVSFAETLTRPC